MAIFTTTTSTTSDGIGGGGGGGAGGSTTEAGYQLQGADHHHHQHQHELILGSADPLLGVRSSPSSSSSIIASSLSPPQISIPSPALSPVRPSTPSPTPSILSTLMDLSFSDSIHHTAAVAAAAGLTTPTKAAPTNMTFLSEILEEETTGSLLQTPPRPVSPPRSSSRYLAEAAGDLSLSSWALSFDSPLKSSHGGPAGLLSGVTASTSSLLHSEDSQTSIISTSSEVDRQLTAMMNENSLDFTSTFRQLAKHVTSGEP